MIHKLIEQMQWGKGLLLLGIALLMFPIVVRNNYWLSVMIFIGLYTILVLGLCLLMGYAGQISLGHAGFYGIGAYCCAVMTTQLQISPWISIVCSMILSGTVALVIAKPIFQLRGHYLAMATLGFGYITYSFFVEATSITGGPSGIGGLPSFSIAGLVINQDLEYYVFVWIIVIVVLAISFLVIDSPFGLALRAIHNSEIGAEAFRVNTSQHKAIVFVLSAIYAGLAGGLYSHYVSFVSPSVFGFHFSIMLVVMATVGGIGNLWGALAGSAIITLITEGLRAMVPSLTNHSSGEYEIIAFGLLMMFVMIFMPQGIVPWLSLRLGLQGAPERQDNFQNILKYLKNFRIQNEKR